MSGSIFEAFSTDLDRNDLKKLDRAFGFTSSGNSEVLNAWFQHTIPAG